MKNHKLKLFFLLIFPFSVLFSCENKKTENKETEKKTENEPKVVSMEHLDFSSPKAFDLSPYEIETTIFIPTFKNGDKNPVVYHDLDEFEWEVVIDSNFVITIKDWGGKSLDDFAAKLKEEKIAQSRISENQIEYKNEKEHSFFEKGNIFTTIHTVKGVNYLFSVYLNNLPYDLYPKEYQLFSSN